MQLIRTINISVSADRLWDIVGNNFNDIGEWTSQVISSKANPDLPEGSGRICTLSGGQVKETFTNFSDTNRQFTYDAEGDFFPFFVRAINNSWSVEINDPNKSTLRLHIRANLLPIFSQIMGPIMKRQMSKTMDILLEEVKHYAETGQIHPRKQKIIQLAAA